MREVRIRRRNRDLRNFNGIAVAAAIGPDGQGRALEARRQGSAVSIVFTVLPLPDVVSVPGENGQKKKEAGQDDDSQGQDGYGGMGPLLKHTHGSYPLIWLNICFVPS